MLHKFWYVQEATGFNLFSQCKHHSADSPTLETCAIASLHCILSVLHYNCSVLLSYHTSRGKSRAHFKRKGNKVELNVMCPEKGEIFLRLSLSHDTGIKFKNSKWWKRGLHPASTQSQTTSFFLTDRDCLHYIRGGTWGVWAIWFLRNRGSGTRSEQEIVLNLAFNQHYRGTSWFSIKLRVLTQDKLKIYGTYSW